jgi:hypothetical protein
MSIKYYSDEPTYHVAVDCIIFGYDEGKLQVLFQHRNIEPYNGELTPLGGFVQENETLDQAAYRVLTERTGIWDLYLEQLEAFGDIGRDPGGRVISVAYFALLNKNKYDSALLRKYSCQWIDIEKMPTLYFDHMKMLKKAIHRLQDKIGFTPIALNLLPQEFTLSQLQKVYETILSEPLDKRNFRKKVNDMSYFVKTEKIDKTTSKRGATLYKFDNKLYHEIKNFHL